MVVGPHRVASPARAFPGCEREPDDVGFHPCNIWRGPFPERDPLADGAAGTCPVARSSRTATGFAIWWQCLGVVRDDVFRIRSPGREALRRNVMRPAWPESASSRAGPICATDRTAIAIASPHASAHPRIPAQVISAFACLPCVT